MPPTTYAVIVADRHTGERHTLRVPAESQADAERQAAAQGWLLIGPPPSDPAADPLTQALARLMRHPLYRMPVRTIAAGVLLAHAVAAVAWLVVGMLLGAAGR